MLVLSRKKDESIIIKREGESPIKITVVRIDNKNKVRIGVEADDDVVVLRSELEKRTAIKLPERSYIPTTTAIANG